MKFVDVANVVKTAAAQVLGSEYMASAGDIAAYDAGQLADLGTRIIGTTSGSNANLGIDVALKTILDECGRIVFESREYTGELDEMFIDAREWGGYMVRYYFGLASVMTDEMWNPDGFTDYFAANSAGVNEALRIAAIEHGFYKPAVTAKIYQKAMSHMTPITTMREQFTVAWTSWDKINDFISAILTQVKNTITALSQAKAHALLCCAVYLAASAGNIRYLLDEFNGETGTLTEAGALKDKDFLAYMLEEIATTRDNMRLMSAAYNDPGNVSFAQGDDNKLVLLNKAEKAAKFRVRANTYNEELLGIGDYMGITAWQAFLDSNGNNFGFDTISTVSINTYNGGIEPISNVEPVVFTLSGVLALAFDRRALGICLKKDKVTTAYTASRDTWNSFYHTLFQQIIDPNFKMMVFALHDASSD